MSFLDEAIKQAQIAADIVPEPPPLKDRCVRHMRAQFDYELDPKAVDARGGKVARFTIDRRKFEYREHVDERFGWCVFPAAKQYPIFSFAELDDGYGFSPRSRRSQEPSPPT
jgi:hypothetical protein